MISIFFHVLTGTDDNPNGRALVPNFGLNVQNLYGQQPPYSQNGYQQPPGVGQTFNPQPPLLDQNPNVQKPPFAQNLYYQYGAGCYRMIL